MNLKFFVFFGFLFFSLFLFGCISQELSFEQRMLCVDLTSYSASSVPSCSSQEECLEKVEKELFSFSLENFSFPLQQKIHSYKNYVALSWLYYNKALEKIKSINSHCINGSYSSLPTEINELNHFLLEAFESIDSANKESFSILLLEKSQMEKENIELIKEELLYDDFVKFTNNLNELSSEEVENSSSYVSLYFSKVNDFNSLSSSLGFSSAYLQEFSSVDLLNYYDQDFISQIKGSSFFVPLLKKTLSDFLPFLYSQQKLQQSLSLLKKMPSFSLSNLLDSFVGAKGSVVSSFSLLLKDDSSHRQFIEEENAVLKKEIESLLSDSQQKAEQISLEAFSSFDSNFFSELFFLLGQENSEISTQDYSFSDISSFRSVSLEELSLISSSYDSLLQKEFLNQISLGEKTSSLKQTALELRQLNTEIDYFNEEIVSGLQVLCDSRTEFIKDSLNESQIAESQNSAKLSDLKSRTLFKAKQYSSSASLEKRLYYCRETVSSFQDFSLAVEDFEAFELKEGQEEKKCISFLEKAFSSGIDLGDFSERYSALLSLASSESVFGASFGESCSRLKEDISGFIFSLPKTKKINENYFELKNYIFRLNSISLARPSLISSSGLYSLNEKVALLEKYFPNELLDLNASIGSLDEIYSDVSELFLESKELLSSALKEYLEESFEVELFPSEMIELNKPFAARTRVVLENSFGFSFSFPLGISLPLKLSSASSLSFSSQNISSALLKENSLEVDLNSFPEGKTFLEFDSNSIVSAKEAEKVLLASQSEALVEKTLVFSAEGIIPKIKVVLPAPSQNLKEVVAFFRQKSFPVSLSGSNLVIFLDSLQDKDKLEVYYYVLNPIDLNFFLVSSSEELDKNFAEYSYSVQIKNLLSLPINSLSLSLPLSISEDSSKIELLDSFGREIKTKQAESGLIQFSLSELLPFQSVSLKLFLKVEDKQAYWKKFAEELEAELLELSSSEAEKCLEELHLLLGQNNLSSPSSIQQLSRLKQQAQALKEKESSYEEYFFQFNELKNSLLQQILGIENDANFLGQNSFADYSKQLFSLSQKAKELLSSSQALFDSNKQEEALKELLKARALLLDKPSSSLKDFFEKKRTQLLEYSNAIFSSSFFSDDSNLLSLKNLILFLGDSVSAALSSNDYAKAASSSNELEQKVLDLNSSFLQSLEKKSFSILEKISSYKQLLASSKSYLNSLKGIFSEETPKNYVLPITEARIKKIEESISKLETDSSAESFSSFESFYKKGNFSAALSLSSSFDSSLNETLQELALLEKELSSAFERIKEDAVASFSSAQNMLEGTKTEEADTLLKDTENAIKEEKFFDAISISQKAPSLISSSPIGMFSLSQLPLAFIPILLFAAVLFVFRYRKKELALFKKSKKERIQKIAREPQIDS